MRVAEVDLLNCVQSWTMLTLLGKSSGCSKVLGVHPLSRSNAVCWAGLGPPAVCSGGKREGPQHPFSLREMQWSRKPKYDDEIQLGKRNKENWKKAWARWEQLPQAAKENSLLTPDSLGIRDCGSDVGELLSQTEWRRGALERASELDLRRGRITRSRWLTVNGDRASLLHFTLYSGYIIFPISSPPFPEKNIYYVFNHKGDVLSEKK